MGKQLFLEAFLLLRHATLYVITNDEMLTQIVNGSARALIICLAHFLLYHISINHQMEC